MRLLSNLHVKGKSAVLPDRAIRSQSHYFIYRPCKILLISRMVKWTTNKYISKRWHKRVTFTTLSLYMWRGTGSNK